MQATPSKPAVKHATRVQYAFNTLQILDHGLVIRVIPGICGRKFIKEEINIKKHATGLTCTIEGETDLPALQVQGPNIIMHLLHVLPAFPPCCVAAHHIKGVVVHSYLAASPGGGCCSIWGASAGPLVLLCVVLPHIVEVPAHAADQLRDREEDVVYT